jgi:hypothetical protein
MRLDGEDWQRFLDSFTRVDEWPLLHPELMSGRSRYLIF